MAVGPGDPPPGVRQHGHLRVLNGGVQDEGDALSGVMGDAVGPDRRVVERGIRRLYGPGLQAKTVKVPNGPGG